MAKGYWIAQIDVTDPDNYPKYKAAASAAIEKFGGAYLIRGGRCEAVEGSSSRSRQVIIEFESYDQAMACYRSPEYQAAAALRQAAADGEVLVLEGV